jgi:hypothetical protein
MINKQAIKIVQTWLDANDSRLWAHDYTDNGYCSVVGNNEDRSDILGGWISVEEAFEYGFLWINEKGIQGLGCWDLPLLYDFVKIRRRCEDCLRKTDNNTLLKIATELGVKLT